MTKRFTLSGIFSIVCFTLFGQFGGLGSGIGGFGQQQEEIKPKARWEITTSKKEFCKGDVVKVQFKGDIDKDWHVYTIGWDCDPGPGPASIELEGSGFTIVDPIKAVDDEPYYEEVFDCQAAMFEGKALFEATIKLTSKNPEITAQIHYQVCTEGSCINESSDKKSLSLSLSKKCEATPPTGTNTGKTTECCEATQEDLSKIKSNLASLEEKVDDYFNPAAAISEETDCEIPRRAGFDDITIEGKVIKDEEESFLTIFFTSFIFGLLALLTPCVFPLIPMTVTFFTHSSKSKVSAISKSLIYGASIIIIYTLLGLIVAKTLGANAVYQLASGWINIVFFLIFFVFALSFLGLFEITLPSKLVNKVDQQSEKGGLLGIFFMAFTLALVSFSCTGPIVGSTLMLAADGYWVKPVVGMLGFSLALAIPFTLFAIFPHALNKLPRSGGWLNSVKVVLGLIELAVGLKFLSNADLAYHWGILGRDTFLVLWIAIFLIMAIYLLGKIRLPHDSPIEKLSVLRLMLATITLSFVIYLIPGLFGAPLKALAGITPPMSTQDFILGRASGFNAENDLCEDPFYDDKLHLPFGLKGYFDLRQAICCAEQQNKPLFIDFTGHTCANCREMEEYVWTDPEILKRLSEDFVIYSAYQDEREIKLNVDERFSGKGGDEIKYLGDYNIELQKEKFGIVAQPYYVVLGLDEKNSTPGDIRLKMLDLPYTYDKSIPNFKKFLDNAKEEYLKSKLMKSE